MACAAAVRDMGCLACITAFRRRDRKSMPMADAPLGREFMTHDEMPGPSGRLKPRHASLAHVLSVVALIAGLVATQLWPDGLIAAPGAFQEKRDAETLQAQPLPRGGPVIVVLKPSAVAQSRGGPRAGAQVVARTVNARPTQVFGAIFPGFAANLPQDQIRRLARDPDVAYIMPDLPVRAAAQTTPTSLQRMGLNRNPTASIDGVDNPIDADIAIIDSGVNRHPICG